MKSDLAAGTLLSAFLWSMLLLSLFAAPALMAARSADPEPAPDSHTADLIRQHQEATSPLSSVPTIEAQAQVHSNSCQEPADSAMREETDGRDFAPEDEPMIRPVGTRAKRIQV